MDRIDLRRIDADTASDADDASAFIGDAAFSGAGGEVRYANRRLSGDIVGGGGAEFQIEIANGAILTVDDLLLSDGRSGVRSGWCLICMINGIPGNCMRARPCHSTDSALGRRFQASSASTSASVGIEGAVPGLVTEMPATAQPKRTPRDHAARQPGGEAAVEGVARPGGLHDRPRADRRHQAQRPAP